MRLICLISLVFLNFSFSRQSRRRRSSLEVGGKGGGNGGGKGGGIGSCVDRARGKTWKGSEMKGSDHYPQLTSGNLRLYLPLRNGFV